MMISRSRYKITMLVSLFIPISLIAAPIEQSQSMASEIQKIEHSFIKKSSNEWGLSEIEWRRYETLKKGRRGLLSPNLDPITLLGIEATTEEERAHFAELSVKQDFQRVEAELAFQRAVDKAWQRLFPDVLPIQITDSHQEITTGRQALFVKEECGLCDLKLKQLLLRNLPIDIYLVDSQGDDEKVKQWAIKQNIPKERVKTRNITLNHDSGKWLKVGKGQMPALLQQGEHGWQLVGY